MKFRVGERKRSVHNPMPAQITTVIKPLLKTEDCIVPLLFEYVFRYLDKIKHSSY